MSDVELIIRIPEVYFEALKKTEEIVSGQRSGKTFMSVIYERVANGTPLPKGHGRLIDADELIKQLEALANDEWNKQVGSSKGLEDVIDIVDDISPIIEADKSESEINNA